VQEEAEEETPIDGDVASLSNDELIQKLRDEMVRRVEAGPGYDDRVQMLKAERIREWGQHRTVQNEAPIDGHGAYSVTNGELIKKRGDEIMRQAEAEDSSPGDDCVVQMLKAERIREGGSSKGNS